MASLEEEVHQSLRDQGVAQDTLALWTEIHRAYEAGGPDAVSDLVDRKVKLIRKSARAEATGMNAAAGGARPKAKSKKKR